jgi:site-specific recombinase XerD
MKSITTELPTELPTRGLIPPPKHLKDYTEKDIEIGKLFYTGNQYSKGYSLFTIDINDMYSRFLSTLSSPFTIKSYSVGINKYMAYCNTKNIDYINSTKENVLSFYEYLKYYGKNGKPLSPKSIGLYLKGNKLFFYFMNELNPNLENPFEIKRIYRNTNTTIKVKELPTMNELKNILSWILNSNDIKNKMFLYITFKYQFKYGARIGSFCNMILKGNRAYFISKGKECETPFIIEKQDIPAFKKCLIKWQSMKQKQLNVFLNRYLYKAYSKGVISKKYTTHRFRALFCNNQIDNGEPLTEVSRRMNHHSLSSITPYIQVNNRNTSNFKGIDID